MAELVDAQVSDTCVERRAGSSPVLGTKQFADAKLRGRLICRDVILRA